MTVVIVPQVATGAHRLQVRVDAAVTGTVTRSTNCVQVRDRQHHAPTLKLRLPAVHLDAPPRAGMRAVQSALTRTFATLFSPRENPLAHFQPVRWVGAVVDRQSLLLLPAAPGRARVRAQNTNETTRPDRNAFTAKSVEFRAGITKPSIAHQ
jgi:hypothetical protein